MFKRLAVLCFAFCLPALAAEDPKPQVIEVVGEAAIQGTNVLGAKDQAIEDALRKAVEQACGTLVVSTSLVDKSQLVEDRILTQAKGYVSKHEILNSSETKGIASVKVRATVSTGKLGDDLASIGLTLARKGLPRIALLILEQRIDQSAPIGWWQGKDGKVEAKDVKVVDQRIAENTLLEYWLKAGFTFIDPETIASGAKVGSSVKEGFANADWERQLGDKLGEADVVIIGRAYVQKSDDLKNVLNAVDNTAKAGTRVTCTATLSLRALNPDNGMTLLMAGEDSIVRTHLDELGCGRFALVEVTKRLSEKFQKDLVEKWNRELQQGNRVRVVFKAVDSVSTFSVLKTAMGGQIRGAKVTNNPRYKEGRADFDVLLSGSVEDAAEQMESWKLKGKKIKVTSMTQNTIEAEIK
jgi:hypothetical protein